MSPTPFKTQQIQPISAHSASTVTDSENVKLALIGVTVCCYEIEH